MTTMPAPPHCCKCAEWEKSGTCDRVCLVACGAVLAMGPTYAMDGQWAWRLPDGTWAEWI